MTNRQVVRLPHAVTDIAGAPATVVNIFDPEYATTFASEYTSTEYTELVSPYFLPNVKIECRNSRK